MYTQIIPTFQPEDEFLIENAYDLWQILLDNKINVDLITRVVMQYCDIYFNLKDRNDERIRIYTAQNYLFAGKKPLSEQIMLC